MFRLQRFLAVANLLAIVLAAMIMTTTYYHLETRQGIAVGEHSNVSFSRILQNTLRNHYTPLLIGEQAPRQTELDAFLAAAERQIAGTDVVKLKFYNLEGGIVFSTHPREIGTTTPNTHYLQAVRDDIFTLLKPQRPGNPFGDQVEQVIETYIPLLDTDGRAIGVLEVYSDITTFMRHMKRDMLILVSVQMLMMGVLYGYLFMVGGRAERIMRRHDKERETYLAEIEENRRTLEQRVDERTADLTQTNRQLEKEIRQRELSDERLRKFAQAVEQAPTSVLMTNIEGVIEYVNPRFCEVTGYSAEEVLGKTPRIMNSGKMPEAVFADLWQNLTSGEDWRGEVLNRKKNGELLWESQIIAPIKNEEGEITHFIAVKEDITEARRNLEWLRIHERALESSSNAICILDAQAEGNPIIYANRSFTQITGYRQEEACGRSLSFLYADDDTQEEFLPCRQALALRTPVDLVLSCHHKDGHIFWNELSLSPVLDEHKRVTHFIAVMEDITHRKRSEEQLIQLATHDTLTGLPNRSLLLDRTEQAVHHAHRDQNGLALLFIDLDHFKLVNDNLGHSTGDALLVEVAKRLVDSIRECDTVGRQSGDEFVVLLTDLYDQQVVEVVIDRILSAFRRPFQVADRELEVTCSIGLCLYPDHGTDVETLYRHADIAMYHAKEAGRNTYAFYEPIMGQELSIKTRLKQDLKTALANREFQLHYQPQVNLQDGSVSGAEALIRWVHPELGTIPPFKFITIAEETDLILGIGDWVLREACQECRRWHDRGHTHMRVAVNLSMRQLQRQNLVALTQEALADAGLEGHHLELEITESMVMTNPEEVTALLHQLKALGVCLSIDDFGTGYSSLAYLKRLPIDRVKIDRTFVQNITHDQDDAAIASATISMSHNLRCEVVAEGVETRDQLRFLRDRQCDQMQGYYFSRPVPSEALQALLDEGECIDPTSLQRSVRLQQSLS